MAEIVGVVSASFTGTDRDGRQRAILTVRVKRFFGRIEEVRELAWCTASGWKDVTDGGGALDFNSYVVESWFTKALMSGVAKEVARDKATQAPDNP